MLVELTISNFAIIDSLRLTLGPDFNVFTGETGAGKSILLDAVSALVGERVGAEVVRAGAERATVEGIFDVRALIADGDLQPNSTAPHDTPPGIDEPNRAEDSFAAALAAFGVELEEGTLILAREIGAHGRHVARINGRATPLSALQRLASHLIDIHGQGAHLSLLRPDQHVYFLDRYANTVELREQVATLVAELRATQRELERLRRDEREIERRIELLRYQVDEIEAARLTPGEIEELERERSRLANAERLGELTVGAHDALVGDEAGDISGALDGVVAAQRSLTDLLRLDSTLAEHTDSLEQAAALLEDVAAALRSYQDEIAADPARQVEVEERWDLLARLRRKYGATVEEILRFAETAALELDELSHREERLSDLAAHERRLRERIGERGALLSAKRQEAGIALARAMERQLDELNMRRARFSVDVTQTSDAAGAVVPKGAESAALAPGSYAFSATGLDRVEFLLAPNVGEPLKPLARIASGGETSRLMLALKTVLTQADAVPILIFDEIDAGISGQSGHVVGEKLWSLGRAHQVLCVTHLPQIAALADEHFAVAKQEVEGRTRTLARRLTASERVTEIGHMLGGSLTDAARANAEDILKRASKWKKAHARQASRA